MSITNNEIINNVSNILDNIVKDKKCVNDDEIFLPKYISKNCLHKKILVLSGGGIKGISFLGALHALYELNILQNIQTFSGTSVGSLILFLYIIGYTPNDMYELIKKIDLSKVKKIAVPLFLNEYGLNSGDKLMTILHKLITSKKINIKITFSELFEKFKKTFIITSVNINEQKIEYFSHLSHPNMEVIQAIRMSISIPFVFTPVSFNNCMYVDGGCIDNFPISYFSDDIDDVIGICTTENNTEKTKIETLYDYAINVICSILNGISTSVIKSYEKYIINIVLDSVSVIDFDISNDNKTKLFNIGYKTTHEYFEKLKF
jgi:NTE family protein